MRDYLLGLITLPALFCLGVGLMAAWSWLMETLDRCWGITFDVRVIRTDKTDDDAFRVSDYVLQHNIWWEKSLGPFFAGGWYREEPKYEAPSHAFATRWIGLGSPDGVSVMVYRKRDLGLVEPLAKRSADDD